MTERARTSVAPPPTCGPYELLVRIGKGGMASVYLARAREPGGEAKLVAIKILHPHLAEQAEFVDMLLDEAKLASMLQHPNVVGTVDVGRDEDRIYMVMEYVEGVALDRLLRRSPEDRKPSIIIPLAIDGLRGLHAAHSLQDRLGRSLGLVHRDVTPGNIIVGIDGTARLADFGVAKARARITKTRAGIVKGKAGFVAPEVLLGQEIDGRADVFSMGVLLWNALTGENLFDTDDLASSLNALMNADVPAPSTVGLQPPPIFDAPILGALHREPEFRYSDAEDMAEALSDALLVYGDKGREPVSAWVREHFEPQLAKRRTFARQVGEEANWDAERSEPLSTSGVYQNQHEDAVIEPPGPETRRLSRLRVALIVALSLGALIGAGLLGAWLAG